VYAGFKKASLKNHITLTSQRKGRNAKPPEEKMSTLKTTTLVQCTTQNNTCAVHYTKIEVS